MYYCRYCIITLNRHATWTLSFVYVRITRSHFCLVSANIAKYISHSKTRRFIFRNVTIFVRSSTVLIGYEYESVERDNCTVPYDNFISYSE